MNRIFKGLALFALIACVVWVAVLWRWQATVRDVGTLDIATYLVALPFTLFGLTLLTRWAWSGLAEKQTRRDAALATDAAKTAPVAPAADEAARHATVQLLCAHLVCAAGSSASELQAAAKAGEPRPALDAELRDEDGLPIFTGRIADLDVAETTRSLEPLLTAVRARRPEWAGGLPGDHVVRALAALRGPLGAAVDSLMPWSHLFDAGLQTAGAGAKGATDPTGTASAAGAAGTASERAGERRVRVLLGWPVDWSAFEQELGRSCAADWLAASGGSTLPARLFAITAHSGTGEDLLLHADRLLQTLARERRDEPVIVAACRSAVGESATAAMERAGTLFGSKRPNGHMPGEAAAALVLAGADWPAMPDVDDVLPHLHRPVSLRRDKSVDAAGRVSGEVVGEAIARALATGRIGAEALAGLVCDADLHTPRNAEFHGASVRLLPALDTTEDMRLLATVTGAVGVVSPLLVLACAAERAVAAAKPQLALTVGDAFARLALVVLPAPPAAPQDAASTASKAGESKAAA